jgi:peptidoglycan/xylan/chitin deacetylase (PgdA/CDA1 family)
LPPVFSAMDSQCGGARRLFKHALIFMLSLLIFFMQCAIPFELREDTIAEEQGDKIANSAPAQASARETSADNAEEAVHIVVPEDDVQSSVPLIPRDEILRSVPAAGKKVALTFDDGPSAKYTVDYLRVLRENQVPATFFLIGRNVQQNPSLVSLIAGEGHEIGNHTYDHPNLKRKNKDSIRKQISSTSKLLNQWTQQDITLMRPPGGNFGPGLEAVAAEMDMRICMWSVNPKDWEKNKKHQDIIASIKKQLRPGAVILLHEGKPETLKVLPILINDLRKDGWEFVTISELVGDSPESTTDRASRGGRLLRTCDRSSLTMEIINLI